MSFPWGTEILKMETEMSFLTAEMACSTSDHKHNGETTAEEIRTNLA